MTRDQLDRLGVGKDLKEIPWNSKRFKFPPRGRLLSRQNLQTTEKPGLPGFSVQRLWHAGPANLTLPLTHAPINRSAPIPRATPGRSANMIVVIHAPQGEVVVPVRIWGTVSVQVGGQAGRQSLHLRRENLSALTVGFPLVVIVTFCWHRNRTVTGRPRWDVCIAEWFPSSSIQFPRIDPWHIRTFATAAGTISDILLIREIPEQVIGGMSRPYEYRHIRRELIKSRDRPRQRPAAGCRMRGHFPAKFLWRDAPRQNDPVHADAVCRPAACFIHADLRDMNVGRSSRLQGERQSDISQVAYVRGTAQASRGAVIGQRAGAGIGLKLSTHSGGPAYQ